jgi:hypothetical protein
MFSSNWSLVAARCTTTQTQIGNTSSTDSEELEIQFRRLEYWKDPSLRQKKYINTASQYYCLLSGDQFPGRYFLGRLKTWVILSTVSEMYETRQSCSFCRMTVRLVQDKLEDLELAELLRSETPLIAEFPMKKRLKGELASMRIRGNYRKALG